MTNTRKLLVLLLVTMPLLAQVQPRTKKIAGELQISGVVVSAASGQPLARARVGISSTEARDKIESMITGSDGRFSFDHLMRGKYQLVAERAGFPTQSFDQHDQYSSAIAVGPGLK